MYFHLYFCQNDFVFFPNLSRHPNNHATAIVRSRSVAALGGDTDPPAAEDDRSTLSNSSPDLSEEAYAFYDQLSSYLAVNSDDKDIQRYCRRFNHNKSYLVLFDCDARCSLAMVQKELDYISDDDVADLQGALE